MRLGQCYFHDKVPDNQLFGMEVELENVCGSDSGDIRGWRDIEDGSLRNDGMEFITNPITFPTMMRNIARLYEAIETYGWEANSRTGIHLHVDMRMYELEQIEAVLTAYILAEPALFRYCGADREENIYCIPWYRAHDEVDKWCMLRQREAHGVGAIVQGVASRANKYSALYLEPMYRFGSIEFRMAPTWTDVRKTQRWVRVVSQLLYYGVGRTPKNVIEDFNANGADRWVATVMPDLLLPDNMDHLCTYYGVEELAEKMAGYEYEMDEWVMGNHGEPAEVGSTAPARPSILGDEQIRMMRAMREARVSLRERIEPQWFHDEGFQPEPPDSPEEEEDSIGFDFGPEDLI